MTSKHVKCVGVSKTCINQTTTKVSNHYKVGNRNIHTNTEGGHVQHIDKNKCMMKVSNHYKVGNRHIHTNTEGGHVQNIDKHH